MAFDLDDVNKVRVEVIEEYMAWLEGQDFSVNHICTMTIRDWAISQGILGEPTTPCTDESGFSAGAGVKEG